MAVIEAVFQGGVFRPLSEVRLPEYQRVMLNIQLPATHDIEGWLTKVRQMQESIVAQRGCFPDSTIDIAADRMRDE